MPNLISFPSLELPEIEEIMELSEEYNTVGVHDVRRTGPTVIEDESALRDNIRTNAEDAIEEPTMNSQPVEVYMYYATIERARERKDTRPMPDAPIGVFFKRLTGRKHKIVRAYGPNPKDQTDGPVGAMFKKMTGRGSKVVRRKPAGAADTTNIDGTARADSSDLSAEQTTDEKHIDEANFMDVLSTAEQNSAYRLLRVASWQLVFFLITTDVLGWSSSPQSFAYLGFGPGTLIFTFFWLLAFGSGQILWRLYLNMDSERYPIKCYADVGERVFGPGVKHVFNILQSVQLLFNTAMLLVMEGTALSAIIDYKFCFMATCALFAAVAILLGQFKTIRGLGVFTQINIFVNLIVMIICMVGMSQYPPVPSNTGRTDLSEPIKAYGWVPHGIGWYQQVVGVQLAIYSYGGAMIFIEFMAEMRRPHDFWKSAILAQFFCYAMYMLFGVYGYSKQGQYTYILPTVNIDAVLYQGLTNILGLISMMIIMLLYTHVGCKVFYRNVLRGYFRSVPSLAMRSLKTNVLWCATVAGYLGLAWILGQAIPNITDLQTVIGSACSLQFTYTFPMAMLVGHWVQRDATSADDAWEPGVVPWSNRVDTWHDLSRWKRGFRPFWWAKLTLIIGTMGTTALCVLGIYSGARNAHDAIVAGMTKSFSCHAPGEPVG